MQNIIDTHLHIFDLNRFRVLWLEDVEELNSPILMENYLKAWQGKGDYRIEKAVHIELDVIAEQKQAENEYFIALAEDPDSMIAGLSISGNLLSPDFKSYLEPYRDKVSVKGVRHLLHPPSIPSGICLDPRFVEHTRYLGERGLQFEACLRAEELKNFRSLVEQCPDTRFVLNHMGLVDITAFADAARSRYVEDWKRGIKELAEFETVSCKISGLASADPRIIRPAVEHCLGAFGKERVMFASNYPVCNLAVSLNDWISGLLTIFETKTEEERNLFFRENAKRIYGL